MCQYPRVYPAQPDDASTPPKAFIGSRILTALLREVRHVLPPTLFFFVGFYLIAFTKQLILAQHQIEFTGFMLATVAALVVGKAVLVADKMAFLRRFNRASARQATCDALACDRHDWSPKRTFRRSNDGRKPMIDPVEITAL